MIAWNPTSGSLCTTLAANLSDPASWDGYTKYAIVQSVWPDETGMLEPRLGQYDSRYETTPYPTDYLWGPGSREEAIAWLDTAQPEPDTCTTLDRLFIVRAEAGVVFQAMRPAIAAGLPEDATGGHWYLVRADAPIHAFHHVRQLEAGVSTCALTGLCACCPVETLSHGVYRTVLAAADADELRGLPLPPDFAVAVPLPVPRSLPVAAT